MRHRFSPINLVLLAVAGCGSYVPDNAISVPPVRTGDSLEFYPPKYTDNHPQISADGTKLVFISGRDSTAQTQTLKAYKADWPAGGAPGSLSRVTQKELGIEQLAVLSPDAKWVALKVSANGQSDLYLQDYAGANAPVQITNDATAKDAVAFSSDAKMLTWIARAESTDANGNPTSTSSAVVLAIGDGSSGALAAANQVTLPAVPDPKSQLGYLAQLFWLPVKGTTYTLAEGRSSGDGQPMVTYYQFAFPDTTTAKTVTPTLWSQSYQVDTTVQPIAGSSVTLLARKLLPSDYTATPLPTVGYSPKVGDGKPNPQTDGNGRDFMIEAAAEPAFLPNATGSTPARFPVVATPVGNVTQVPGFSIISGAISADGATYFLFDRVWFECAGNNGNEDFGTAIHVVPQNLGGWTAFLPRLMATDHTGVPEANPATPTVGVPFTEAYDTVSDPCDRARPDGTRSPIDTTIEEGVVNASATASAYRIAYTTLFTPHFDSECGPKVGDPEVMVMNSNGTTNTIYPLSNNQAGAYDDDRGTSGACALAP